MCVYQQCVGGSNQRWRTEGKNIWTQVHEKFLILSQKHFSDNALDMPMSANVFNSGISFYLQLKSVNRRGWNEDKYIEEAGNLYLSEVGEPFKYVK
jgi:hypothetical protein